MLKLTRPPSVNISAKYPMLSEDNSMNNLSVYPPVFFSAVIRLPQPVLRRTVAAAVDVEEQHVLVPCFADGSVERILAGAVSSLSAKQICMC